jgi:hypothetical protein
MVHQEHTPHTEQNSGAQGPKRFPRMIHGDPDRVGGEFEPEPVISASKSKKARLRGLESPQFTGTLW